MVFSREAGGVAGCCGVTVLGAGPGLLRTGGLLFLQREEQCLWGGGLMWFLESFAGQQ